MVWVHGADDSIWNDFLCKTEQSDDVTGSTTRLFGRAGSITIS